MGLVALPDVAMAPFIPGLRTYIHAKRRWLYAPVRLGGLRY